MISANEEGKKSYIDFTELVEEVRKKSNGLPGGISMKIPNKSSEQFKVFIRIMEKMFKKEMSAEKTQQIREAVGKKL